MVGAPERPPAQAPPPPSGPHPVATAATVLAPKRPEAASSKQRMPAAALLAFLGVLSTIGAVSAAVALRSGAAVSALEQGARPGEATASNGSPDAGPDDSSAAEAPPPPTTATPEQLDEARAQGAAALTTLAERFPKDAAVLKALVIAQARDRAGLQAAVGTMKKLLELAPAEADSADLKPILLRAANATPEIADAAFALMGRRMGSHGPDLLYEIATNPNLGKYPQERAATLLGEEAVRKLATPALLIADDLRRLKQCPTKPLLERARQHGDVRALHYLTPIQKPVKCGFLGMSRCTTCKTVFKEAVQAIQAIEKRRNLR